MFWPSEPIGVPETPPLIVVEILSPDDRPSDVQDKLAEYRQWRVPHIWLADPHTRRLWTFDTRLLEVSMIDVPELGLTVKPSDIF